MARDCRLPQIGAVWCNQQRAKLTVVLVFASSIVVCIPNSINIDVHMEAINESDEYLADNHTPPDNLTGALVWKVVFNLGSDIDRFINSLNFWIQAIMVRLVPCLVLTVLSALLVKTMRVADARLKTLKSASALRLLKRQRKTNRTTRILLVIVILFLATELPQGVVMILSGVNRQYTDGIYLNLGDLFDITQ